MAFQHINSRTLMDLARSAMGQPRVKVVRDRVPAAALPVFPNVIARTASGQLVLGYRPQVVVKKQRVMA